MPHKKVSQAENCFAEAQAHLGARQIALAARKFNEALELGFDPLRGVGERWLVWMLSGQFERAWQETDRLELLRRQGVKIEGTLIWDGSDYKDKIVLLRHNHGLGDCIQFLRYAPLLRQKCRTLIAKARPIMIPLLETISSIDRVIPDSAPDPSFNCQIECTELPFVFRTTVETIPAPSPYLYLNLANGGHRAANPLHIGLAWAAGPWNPQRSIALSALRPLSHIRNVVFQSVQWGEQWIEAQQEGALNIANRCSTPREDLLETAALISSCDLVITVDTMVAHLAGALGKPVWVLLHFDSDWRWMVERTDSPWYPTMKLFRQPVRGDWSTPIKTIAAELRRLACK